MTWLWWLLVRAAWAQDGGAVPATQAPGESVDLFGAAASIGGTLGTLLTVLLILWRMGLLSKPKDYDPQLQKIQTTLEQQADQLARVDRHTDEARQALSVLIDRGSR